MPAKTVDDWLRAAQQRGLLLAVKEGRGEGVPVTSLGVSLAYLERLAACLASEAECGPDATTAEVMQKVMACCSRSTGKTRLWDLVPSQHTGSPHWYIVHAWSATFSEMVAAVTEALAPNPRPGEPPLPAGFKDGLMLWLDLFAINHAAAPRDHAETAALMVEAQLACSTGLLLVVDRGAAVLSRAWPLYEVYLHLYYATQPNLHLALPAHMGVADVIRLEEACKVVDISKADITRPQDKTCLMSEVKRTWGLQRTNRQLQEELHTALHYRLRWTTSTEDKANLAALLLQLGELTQLQLLLCSLPGLKSDDEELQEIREIFKVYDADGSGQLDEDEFVQVMKAAGWSEEDALTIFSEVDTDQGGSVELNEFERWWEKSQESGSRMLAPELSLPALASNLERLPGYLRRYELPAHADHFAACLPQIQTAADAVKGQGPEAVALPAPTLEGGDVSQLLNAVADAAESRQYRSACKTMYNLLIANRALLPFPTTMLQLPEGSAGAQSQSQLLALYMVMFAQLLEYQGPDRIVEVEYLYNTAAELWEAQNANPSPCPTAGGGRAAAKPVESSPEIQAMMRVFHGFCCKQTKLLNAKVKGEVLTMSQFLAARKKRRSTLQLGGASKAQSSSLYKVKAGAEEAVSSLSLYRASPIIPSLADLRQKLMREGADIASGSRSPSPHPQMGSLMTGSVQSRKLAQTMMAMHFGPDAMQQRSATAANAAAAPAPAPAACASGAGGFSDEEGRGSPSPTAAFASGNAAAPRPSNWRTGAMVYASRMHMSTGRCSPAPTAHPSSTCTSPAPPDVDETAGNMPSRLSLDAQVTGARSGLGGWQQQPSDGALNPASRRASVDDCPRPSTTLEALTQSLATVSRSGVSRRVRTRSLLLLSDACIEEGGSMRREPCSDNLDAACGPRNLLLKTGSSNFESPTSAGCQPKGLGSWVASGTTQSMPQARTVGSICGALVAPAGSQPSSGTVTAGPSCRTSPTAHDAPAPTSMPQVASQLQLPRTCLSRCGGNSPTPPMAGSTGDMASRLRISPPAPGTSTIISTTPDPGAVASPGAVNARRNSIDCSSPTHLQPGARPSCNPGATSPWPADDDLTQASPKPMFVSTRRRSLEANEWAMQARLALASAQASCSSPSNTMLHSAPVDEAPATLPSPSPTAAGLGFAGTAKPPAGRPAVVGGTLRRRSVVELDCSPKASAGQGAGGTQAVEVPSAPSPVPAEAAPPAQASGIKGKDKWGDRLPSLLLNILPGRRGNKDLTGLRTSTLPAI